jgi:hypothetical protein
MIQKIKRTILLLFILQAISVNSNTWSMEKNPNLFFEFCDQETCSHKTNALIECHSSDVCPVEIWEKIVILVGIDSYMDNNMRRLAAVSKLWGIIISSRRYTILEYAICKVYSIDHETCEQYLKSRLTFRLHPFRDLGQVELSIMDVFDPLAGAFNLSRYKINGEPLDRYIGSISTGYQTVLQTGYIDINTDYKPRLWVTPRFLVEKEIREGRAQLLGPLFSQLWPISVTVGLFWISGNMYGCNLDWYVYLINQPLDRGNHLWNTIWDNAQSTKDGFLKNPLHAILCKCLSLSWDQQGPKTLQSPMKKAR